MYIHRLDNFYAFACCISMLFYCLCELYFCKKRDFRNTKLNFLFRSEYFFRSALKKKDLLEKINESNQFYNSLRLTRVLLAVLFFFII